MNEHSSNRAHAQQERDDPTAAREQKDERYRQVIWQAICRALDSDHRQPKITQAASLPSEFDVGGLATATIAAAGSEIAALVAGDAETPQVAIDQRLACTWFAGTVTPVDFDIPTPFDPVFGDYECRDGWVKLHTNAPAHRDAALTVLGCGHDRSEVAAAVRQWSGNDLETEIVDAGGCAARMRTSDEWSEHPQGLSVSAEPLIVWSGEPRPWPSGDPDRPLAGLRVLDVTRILAGPVCTRFLAGWGADVLRIDPPDWHELGLAPEVTVGKRCARLDLRSDGDAFGELVQQADVVVHGLRPGALHKLGADQFDDVIDVSLDAYGWSGPWAGRRGFDSLVQMSCGIAAAGMANGKSDRPLPLPVQALDHATGYLMAAAVVRALRGGPSRARTSLARTAELLRAHPGSPDAPFEPEEPTAMETTSWGTLLRALPPVTVGGKELHWDRPARPLGSDEASW